MSSITNLKVTTAGAVSWTNGAAKQMVMVMWRPGTSGLWTVDTAVSKGSSSYVIPSAELPADSAVEVRVYVGEQNATVTLPAPAPTPAPAVPTLSYMTEVALNGDVAVTVGCSANVANVVLYQGDYNKVAPDATPEDGQVSWTVADLPAGEQTLYAQGFTVASGKTGGEASAVLSLTVDVPAPTPTPAPVPSGAYTIAGPQHAQAPNGGAWSATPALADRFNPAYPLDNNLWYDNVGEELQNTSDSDAAFWDSSQVTIDPDGNGLALTASRQPSPVTANGKTLNYLSGQAQTFSDGQPGTPRFLINPSSGDGWAVVWDMKVPVNTDPSGILGGLDMGVWIFDANAEGIGAWKIIELDFLELFGWGSGSPAYGPNEFVDPATDTFGANWEQTLNSTVFDPTAFHHYEAVLDNVNRRLSLTVDGVAVNPASGYASWMPAASEGVYCGFILSHDLNGRGGDLTWTGDRTVYVRGVSIWPTATNPGAYKGGGVAAGTTLAAV